jgi:hypothetical protein
MSLAYAKIVDAQVRSDERTRTNWGKIVEHKLGGTKGQEPFEGLGFRVKACIS